jgi:hypothetical protein
MSTVSHTQLMHWFEHVEHDLQCVRRQLLQQMQGGDDLCFEDVINPAALEQLVAQPGVPERLLELLPGGQQTQVRSAP